MNLTVNRSLFQPLACHLQDVHFRAVENNRQIYRKVSREGVRTLRLKMAFPDEIGTFGRCARLMEVKKSKSSLICCLLEWNKMGRV